MRFGDETECYSAMTEMQGMMLGSRALRLSQATPKKSSSMGGGMGMPMGMPMGGGGTGGGVPRVAVICMRACTVCHALTFVSFVWPAFRTHARTGRPLEHYDLCRQPRLDSWRR